METRNLCVQIPAPLHRRLRIYTARHDTCLSAILESLIERFVDQVVTADELETERVGRAERSPSTTSDSTGT